MEIKYNPERPSEHYDAADLAALKGSNIMHSVAIKGMRFDNADDASIFFARELDYIKAKTYDKIYPELNGVNMFPVSHEAPEGAETFTYYTYDKTGMAEIISNYASDLPRADIKGLPTTANIRSVGSSYGYNVQEMRAARMAGKSLDTRKGQAAKYAIDRIINRLAFAGDVKNGIMGMLSTGNNIPLYTLAASSSKPTSTRWIDKSAAEILADINGMVGYQADLTQDVERADTLALPPAVFLDITSRQIPSTGLTVKKFLMDNAPYLKEIKSVAELAGKNTETNPYGKDVALLYTNSKEKLSLEIPMSFYQYPIQRKGLEIEVPCEARAAGMIIYYPLSALIAVGV